MQYLVVFIPGTPVPYSHRVKPVVDSMGRLVKISKYVTPERREWEKKAIPIIRSMARAFQLDHPVCIDAQFFFQKPKVRRKKLGDKPRRVKPDWDNLVKSVCDVLQKADVVKDDSRIWYGRAMKMEVDDPSRVGTWIRVYTQE